MDKKMRMSQALEQWIKSNLGTDVAYVYKSVLEGDEKQIERLLAGAGERILINHEEKLRELLNEHPDMSDLQELHGLILQAINTKYGHVPVSARDFPDINPEIADINK